MLKNKNKGKQIVNILSLSRVFGAFFMPLFFHIGNIPLMIILLSCLFITDFLDGRLARYWHVQTRGGALIDPLGDKLLVISCIVYFGFIQKYLLIPLILELTISLLNIDRTLHMETVKSSMIGKAKTWILSITIILSAINLLKPSLLNDLFNVNYLAISENVVFISSLITIFMQIITLIKYTNESLNQIKNRTNKIPKIVNFREALEILFDDTRYEKDKDKPLMEIIKK